MGALVRPQATRAPARALLPRGPQPVHFVLGRCGAGRHVPRLAGGQVVTCQSCKVAMKELKGHVYHKQRKWKCPRCARIKMRTQERREGNVGSSRWSPNLS